MRLMVIINNHNKQQRKFPLLGTFYTPGVHWAWSCEVLPSSFYKQEIETRGSYVLPNRKWPNILLYLGRHSKFLTVLETPRMSVWENNNLFYYYLL